MKIHVALCCRNEITADAFRDLNLAMLDGADYWKHRFGKESVFKVQTVTRMHVVDGRSTLVENAIKDAWDTPIQYEPRPRGTTPFTLISLGGDKLPGTEDDIDPVRIAEQERQAANGGVN